jgi:hypothetical protein
MEKPLPKNDERISDASARFNPSLREIATTSGLKKGVDDNREVSDQLGNMAGDQGGLRIGLI